MIKKEKGYLSVASSLDENGGNQSASKPELVFPKQSGCYNYSINLAGNGVSNKMEITPAITMSKTAKKDIAVSVVKDVIETLAENNQLLRLLLNKLRDFIKSCNDMPDHYVNVMAVFAVSTYMVQLSPVAPLMIFNAPQPNCGKSQALNTMYLIVFDPFKLSGSTAASFHNEYIDHESGCMVVDDFDSVPKSRKESIWEKLIQGYMQGNPFKKSSSNGEIIEINIFGSKVIAMNGYDLTDSLLSRILAIQCQRKDINTVVRDPLTIPEQETEQLRDEIEACIDAIYPQVKEAMQANDLPLHQRLHDRAHNNWKLMRVIAKLAGSGWFNAIEEAMDIMDTVHQELSLNLRVLIDVKALVDHQKKEDSRYVSMPSKDLYSKLQQLNHGEWKKETSTSLGRVLRAYSINYKHSMMYNRKQTVGVKFDELESVFQRYIDLNDHEMMDRYQMVKGSLTRRS